jgi:undecaprenyl pyrophosphate phosphatase UppP
VPSRDALQALHRQRQGADALGTVPGLVAGLLGAVQVEVTAVGLAASALAGFAAIWRLLRYLQRASTAVFIVYRIGLGVALLVLVAAR